MEQTPIDQIVVEMAGGVFEEEVKRARQEYFKQIQDLREDDPSYERLTFCFLNWYVFDRPMDSGQGTPLQIFVRRAELAPEERARFIGMAGNINSLFEVKTGSRAVGFARSFHRRDRISHRTTSRHRFAKRRYP